MTSRSDKRPFWGFVGGLVVALAFGGLVAFTVQIMRLDPFAEFRTQGRDPDRITLSFGDVLYRRYQSGRLVASARIDRVEVDAQRRFFRARGLREGVVYSGGKGDPAVRFEAAEGVWNTYGREFVVSKGATLWGEDFRLRVQEFRFLETSQELVVPGKIEGRLADGTIEAQSLIYNVDSRFALLGPSVWTGRLQPPESEAKTTWTIKTSEIQQRGDVQVASDAEATDGEIIVKAKYIERNVKTDVIVATGEVQYFSRDTNVLAEKATVYRREKRAVIEGNVTVLVKAEDDETVAVVPLAPFRPVVPPEIARERPPAPRTDQDRELDRQLRSPDNWRQYPVQLYAQRVEVFYERGQRRAIATGEPQARQDLPGGRWRMLWAHRAVYDGEADRLRLESEGDDQGVRFLTSIGDDLVANWFEISTKEGEDAWSASRVSGVVVPDEEDLPQREGERGPNRNPPPAGPPPGLRGPIGAPAGRA